MKQVEFIKLLEKQLKENNVSDIEEIIEEYNDHFEYKLLDGYTEEEIGKKLGNPIELANQYEEILGKVDKETNKKIVTYLGLFYADFMMVIFFIILASWIIVSAATTLALFGIGGTLFLGITPFEWFPSMPYWVGAIFSITMFSFTVLMAIVTHYSYLYLIQVFKSFRRFHQNTVNHANNKPTLPSISATPMMNRKKARFFRKAITLTLTFFSVSFIIGYVVAWIASGNVEFWHGFGWFM